MVEAGSIPATGAVKFTIMYGLLFALIFTLIIVSIWELGKWQIRKNTDLAGIPKLDKDLWKIFSQYIRSKDADWKGFVNCFTCDSRYEWKYTDAGHCFPKGATGTVLKYEERNVKPQCKICNQVKGGMRKEFEHRLQLLYGDGIIKELARLTEASLTVADYREKISYYSDQLKIINLSK